MSGFDGFFPGIRVSPGIKPAGRLNDILESAHPPGGCKVVVGLGKFAFVIHPPDTADIARRFPFTGFLPQRLLEAVARLAPPVKLSAVTGVRSPYGQAGGWLIYLPLTARQMQYLPGGLVARRILQAGRMAEGLGAGIVGLGAWAPLPGAAAHAVERNFKIPVTTGSSYSIATALEGAGKAARLMGYKLGSARVAVFGAAWPEGAVCALMLAREVKEMTLVGREKGKLEELAGRIYFDSGLSVRTTPDAKRALESAEIVVSAGGPGAGFNPEDLLPGAVVLDLVPPFTAGRRVAETREDVLAVEGVEVEVPGWDGTACPALAETMILAMEERYQLFYPGGKISVKQVEEMAALAGKHGFKLGGLRVFDRVLTPADADRVMAGALKKDLSVPDPVTPDRIMP